MSYVEINKDKPNEKEDAIEIQSATTTAFGSDTKAGREWKSFMVGKIREGLHMLSLDAVGTWKVEAG